MVAGVGTLKILVKTYEISVKWGNEFKKNIGNHGDYS
jgi:hypothetical protein